MNYKELVKSLLEDIYKEEERCGFIQKYELDSNIKEMRDMNFNKMLKKFKKELTSLQTIAAEANRLEKNSWIK